MERIGQAVGHVVAGARDARLDRRTATVGEAASAPQPASSGRAARAASTRRVMPIRRTSTSPGSARPTAAAAGWARPTAISSGPRHRSATKTAPIAASSATWRPNAPSSGGQNRLGPQHGVQGVERQGHRSRAEHHGHQARSRPGQDADDQQARADHGQRAADGLGQVERRGAVGGIDEEPGRPVGRRGPVEAEVGVAQGVVAEQAGGGLAREERGQTGEQEPADQQARLDAAAGEVAAADCHARQQVGQPRHRRVVAGEQELGQESPRLLQLLERRVVEAHGPAAPGAARGRRPARPTNHSPARIASDRACRPTNGIPSRNSTP